MHHRLSSLIICHDFARNLCRRLRQIAVTHLLPQLADPVDDRLHGDIHGVPERLQLRPRVRVHQPRYQPDHRLRHPLRHLLRDPPERLLHAAGVAAAHILLGDEHGVGVAVVGEVPPVLPVRGVRVEEHRHAAGEDGVERRPPRVRVARRLQAEARPLEDAHEGAGHEAVLLALPALHQVAEAGGAALPDEVVPDGVRISGTLAAGEGEEVVPLHASHPLLPLEDVRVLGRVEVGRVRHGEVEVRPRHLLHEQHRHVPHRRQTEQLVAPLRVAVRLPLVVPRRPPGHEEVVAPAHGAPLGPPRQPVDELDRRGVLGRGVVAPQVPHDVKPSVERHEDGGGAGGVVGEAVVLPDAGVEDDVEAEVVGGVPALVGEHAVRVVQGRAEAAVGEVLAHVDPRVPVLAVGEDVGVEPRGQVVDVQVPPAAGVLPGDANVAAPAHLAPRRGGDQELLDLLLLGGGEARLGAVLAAGRGGGGDERLARRADGRRAVAVDDEEPRRGGQDGEQDQARQPAGAPAVRGRRLLHGHPRVTHARW
uniref:Uncharacterized protein n=1 Tax=Triticum urartu TaxID=4572 RepID=A0A8R7Q8R3_TRIUA